MILHRIVLNEFFQFERFVLNLEPGVVGIAGPNRAGKTHLLNGIAGSLTADFGRARAKCVRWGAKSKSFIQADWTIDTSRFEVMRELKGDAWIEVNGEKAASGATDVQEWIRRLIRIPETVLREYIFRSQGMLHSMLLGKNADRVSGFMHLCGVAQAGRIKDALAADLRAHFADLGEEDEAALDVLHQRHRAIEQKLQTVRKELDELRKTARDAAWLKGYADGLQKLRERNSQQQEYDRAHSEFVPLQKQLQAAQEALQKLPPAPPDADEAAAAWQAAEATLQLEQTRHQLKQTLGQPEPQAPPDLEELSKTQLELQEQLAVASAAAKQSLARLALQRAGSAVCVTCGQSVNVTESSLEEARVEAERLTAEARLLSDELRIAQSDLERHRQAQVDFLVAMDARRKAEEKLAKLPPAKTNLQAARVAAATAKEALNQATQLSAERSRAEKTVANLSGRHVQASRDLQARKKQLDATNAAMQAIKAKHGIDALASKVFQEEQAKHNELLQREGIERSLVNDLAELDVELDVVRVALERSRPRRAVRDDWRRLAELCQVLARRVVFNRLQALERHTNQTLQDLGEEFAVRIDETLNFKAVYAGGVEDDAEGFSFAQGAMVAVAFLMASNNVFAGRCNFMALDEPAIGFDQEHLADFAELLTRLDAHLRANDRQMLIVTHDQRILESLRQVVTLPRNEA